MWHIPRTKNATRWHLKVHTMCCPWCAHLRCARCEEKRPDFPNCGLDAVGVVGERLLGYGYSRQKKKVAGRAKQSSKQQCKCLICL